ncbi:protein BIG GRAIN 1-like [Phalaenopsis equestris]|uniref:protein BIG GRAIN 1-like n=1 Tax=Phalaenopsis equestris TaxID=78828 RepID=UPI0009E503E6|nr:protein BIG GRAIN 1-like [Phalaenopsis equestris]
MEIWRDGVSRSPHCRHRDHPSFSSTLLDTIYRSIDDEHFTSGGVDSFSAKKKQSDPSRLIAPLNQSQMTRTGSEYWSRRKPCSVTKQTANRSGTEHWTTATSSSSDGSSYGGFSSSEAESVSSRLPPTRLSTNLARSCRNRPATYPPQPQLPTVTRVDDMRAKKERHGSIRSRLLSELRKGRAPASPGARLANFLNSLFPAKSKVSRNPVDSVDKPAYSSPSAYSRSCLSKTPSSRGQPASEKRTVRFCPVSVIVDEDCRPCGHKCVYGGDRLSPALPAAAPPVRSATELLRRSELEEEEEEDADAESDSSSDLFELENLAVGRFQDELPVYETTRLGIYSGVSHRLVL